MLSCRPDAEDLGVGARAVFYERLHDMLPVCDFVVVACPLTSQTTSLFGAKEFELMKKTAYIVNIGRGLQQRHISFEHF